MTNIFPEAAKKNLFHQVILLNPEIPPPFTVGLTLRLDLVMGKKREFPLVTKLVGWIQPQFLIVRLLGFDSPTMAIPNETDIIGRYVYEGQLFGFESKLLQKLSSTIPLWFIQFPQSIEMINLRRSKRISMILEVDLGEDLQVYTKNISRDGAALFMMVPTTPVDIKVGKILEMNFELPDGRQIEKLLGKIVWKHEDRERLHFGIQFDRRCKAQLGIINEYLDGIEKLYKVSSQQLQLNFSN